MLLKSKKQIREDESTFYDLMVEKGNYTKKESFVSGKVSEFKPDF